MPTTALNHFNQDMARARAIANQAARLPSATTAEKLLRDDLYRSAWMFAVGAMDAYFSDAYTDVLARTLRAKRLEPLVGVPVLSKISLPMDVILSSYAVRDNWKWRMAARAVMADKNVLSVKDVKSHLNKMVDGDKLFEDPLLQFWIGTPGWSRWFGAQGVVLQAHLAGGAAPVWDDIRKTINTRFEEVCQRRHDCIHNCDRPKVSPQQIRKLHVKQTIDDIEWLVNRIDTWLDGGYAALLAGLGFSAVTRNAVGC